MGERWTPSLRVDETAAGCRLILEGVAHGNGRTLQEAGDDLIERLLEFALLVRTAGLRVPSELGPPDPRILDFLWELGDLAEHECDLRERIFSVDPAA